MQDIKKISLKIKIPLVIVMFSISSLFITVFLIQNVTSKHIKDDILKKNLTISDMLEKHIYLYLQNAKETVNTAANYATENHYDIEKIKAEMFRTYDNFKYFDLMFLLDMKGNMLFSKPENTKAYAEYNYSDRDYFEMVMNTKDSYISNLHVSRVLGQLHFLIAAPVFDRNGKVIGIIGAGIPLSNIKQVIEEIQNNFDGKIYVVDQRGTLLIDPDIKNIKTLNKIENYTVSFKNTESTLYEVMQGNIKDILKYRKGNEEYYSAVSFVEEVSWMILAEQSEKAILKEMTWLKSKLRDISLLIIAATLTIGLMFAQKISSPLEKLVKEVRKLGYNHENVDLILIESNDEVGELAVAFNDMSIKLKENMNRLKESYNRENQIRQYLDNILKSLVSGIVAIDENNIITIFNNAAEEITGFKREDYIGNDIFIFFEDTGIFLDKVTKEILNGEKIIVNLERNVRKASGDTIPINISISPVLDDNLKVIGIIYLFNDVSRAKKMEEELKKLDRIHILGELSAALIHDIGNPLAGMGNLLEILNANLDDEGLREEIFKMLNEEIKDLNDLIVNFLSFSREASIDRKPTNIINLVEDVVSLLKPEIINKGIKLEKNYIAKEKCMARINRANIKQALINILVNSIQAVDEEGIISIIVEEYINKVSIHIIDNGVGIQEEDMSKLFEPFYTSKKGGTGLGLPSTFKIIKEHEGVISVKSEFGKGTKITIELKK
ncbi:PAS domain-containing sensor histidine kinase [Proteiniborus sp. MB09-C3]|uniref:PAS domain-containing sensor histidine kinase n=1 Tax=Proteiniborus sp. MB09-C3 TaxID=3050072 RepID=UPI0025523FF1|nr:PAS domain-containing sensor histidine kinase [Proteiniborus sp. MB09-C3]WIV13543.1 cache domain-containing protein [Proteiniborus sp. MB09-C3]